MDASETRIWTQKRSWLTVEHYDGISQPIGWVHSTSDICTNNQCPAQFPADSDSNPLTKRTPYIFRNNGFWSLGHGINCIMKSLGTAHHRNTEYDLHSWLTLYVPSLLIWTIPRQPPPQLSEPGRKGFPFPSSARFHMSPVDAPYDRAPSQKYWSSYRNSHSEIFSPMKLKSDPQDYDIRVTGIGRQRTYCPCTTIWCLVS